MKTINNKTFAQAFVAAAAMQGKTISEIVKALPKAPRATKAAASAMADVVENAKKAAEKPANYSAEVTEKLLAEWAKSDKSKDAVAALATMFGKATRSIVAKLSKEQVYVKQEYTSKNGEKPVSKEQHVLAIAAFIGCNADKLESLEKANKGALVMVENALKKSAQDHDNANSDSPDVKAKKAESLSAIVGYSGADSEALQSLMLASKESLAIIASALAFSAGEDEDDEDQAVYDDLMAYAANDIGDDAQQAA